MSRDVCEVERCGRRAESIYYGRGVCGQHWSDHCDDDKRFDLKKKFNISEADHGRLHDER